MSHLKELGELVWRFDSTIPPAKSPDEFSLENGLSQLSRQFVNVTMNRYEDALVITDAEVLTGRARSWTKPYFAGDRLTGFFRFLEQELASQGSIRVTKDSGLFVAEKSEKV